MLWLVSLMETKKEDTSDEPGPAEDTAQEVNEAWNRLSLDINGMDLSLPDRAKETMDEMEQKLKELEQMDASETEASMVDQEKEEVSISIDRVLSIRSSDRSDPLFSTMVHMNDLPRSMQGGKSTIRIEFLVPASGPDAASGLTIISRLHKWREISIPLMVSSDTTQIPAMFPMRIMDVEVLRTVGGCQAYHCQMVLRKVHHTTSKDDEEAPPEDPGPLRRAIDVAGYRTALEGVKLRFGLG